MNRSLLVYFKKLYEIGNITRAAEELYLSRQSLSGYIAKLEKETGATLFVRSRQGVELTEAGVLLRDFTEREEARYRESERDLDKTLDDIRSAETKVRMSIALPMNLFSRRVIEAWLMEGDGRNEYSLNLTDVPQPNWHDVSNGLYDIILSRKLPPKMNASLTSTLLLPQRAFLLVKRDSPFAKEEAVDFQNDLSKVVFLCVYEYMLNDLEIYAQRQKLDLRYTSPNAFIIKRTLLSTDRAVCLLPEITANELAAEGDELACVPLTIFPQQLDAYLIYKSNPPKHVRKFVDATVRLCAELAKR